MWGFDEIYGRSMPLPLTPTLAIRMPTVPGYAAAKLVSWLDRSSWRETRDANDLALITYWYAQSPEVEGRLYDTTEGQQVLLNEELDLPRAATRLLGKDVSAIVGPQRVTELRERWPGDLDFLIRNITISTLSAWLNPENRRGEIIDALTRGLWDLA